jgi:hypothetical protein
MSPQPTSVRTITSLAGDPAAAIAELDEGATIMVITDDDRVVGVLAREPQPRVEPGWDEDLVGGGFSRVRRGQRRSFNDTRGWLLRWVASAAAALVLIKVFVPASAGEVTVAVVVVVLSVLSSLDLVGWKPDPTDS